MTKSRDDRTQPAALMGIYIVEDDETMIETLSDMIEAQGLGEIIGSTAGGGPVPEEIVKAGADIILVDFLMPGMDGAELVETLRELGCGAKFIMISQVSSKDMIGRAYEAGISFFINKPVNVHELRSVLRSTARQIRDERTIAHLRSMFFEDMKERPEEPAREKNGRREKRKEAEKRASVSPSGEELEFRRRLMDILGQLGMAGEKGSPDIVRICLFLRRERKSISGESIRDICSRLSAAPKSMEQRMRRAIAAGLSNVAHLGVEDFLNETFVAYSSTLFPFEEVRSEMDFIRGKRAYGGRSSIKRFIESLMVAADRTQPSDSRAF